MKKFLYICFLFWVNSVFLMAQEKKESGQSSLYTDQYITDIYMSEPDRALQLLDEAEKKKVMMPARINDLRSMVYRNRYQCKLAFRYARRAYVQDSIAGNSPEHLLKMTIALAELSSLLSEYEVSNRYVVEGIRQARDMENKRAEAKLLFCMGENKRWLSFKKDAYETFDEAIQLLRDADDAYGLRMLSYFNGVKMSFLIDDGLIDDALSVGLYRQKLLDKMEGKEGIFKEYPDIKKGYYLSMRLGLIYHQCKFKDIALTRLARWYDEVDKSGFLTFGRVARSTKTHYLDIINFFERRATNAAAESFNAKIKAFRAQFRGVRDRAFFLYRLAKLYA